MVDFGRPYLEVDSVRSALSAMLRARPLEKNHPLKHFLSFRDAQTLHLHAEPVRDTEIFDGIARAIRLGLRHYRAARQLSRPTLRDDIDRLKADFQQEHPGLEAWSLLYFRFVRIDLDLSVERIAQFVRQDTRTVSRRQKLGIKRLTELLLRRENRIRRRERRVLMRAGLPSFYPPQLFGRDADIERGYANLAIGEGQPHYLLIHGPSGIGKTALAHNLADRLISALHLKQVLWLDVAESSNVLDLIALHLGLSGSESTRLSLAAYLGVNDVLIVLDHADALVVDCAQLASLIAAIGSARVIICTTAAACELPAGMASLPITDLDKESAFQLMEHQHHLRNSAASPLDPERMTRIFHDLGGNPRALRFAVGMGHHYSPEQIAATAYDSLWNGLPRDAWLLWLMMSLRQKALDAETLVQWLPQNAEASIATLNQAFVVDVHHDSDSAIRWEIMPLARTFGLNKLRLHQPEHLVLTQIAVGRVADSLTRIGGVECVYLLEQVRQTALPIAFQLDLGYAFAPQLERAGAWLAWRDYLLILHGAMPAKAPDWLWVSLHLGIALRWLAAWDEAAYHLGAVIEWGGSASAFEIQASAMIELAAVYRFQNDFATADQLLRRAETFYFRRHELEGFARVVGARLQLMLDTNQLDSADDLLNEARAFIGSQAIADWPPRLLAFAAQIALRRGDPARAIHYAEAAQVGLEGDVPIVARLNAWLAQAYYALGQLEQKPKSKYFERALSVMATALSMMDDARDPLGHARGRLNLALMLIARGQRRAAAEHLKGLSAEFEKLGDLNSLRIAAQNLEMINLALRKR